MKKLLILLFAVLESHLVWAQLDTIEQFYQINFYLDIDKFEREHDQLDGKTVKMIPYRSSELFGFAKKGNPNKLIIQPQFEQVYGVYKDKAIVKDTNAGYGLIDKTGEYLVPPYFSNLYPEGNVFHGLYFGQADSIYNLPEHDNSCWVNYYFDAEGALLFSEKAHDFVGFNNGDSLAWFRFGRTYHIRSNTGRLVKSFQNDTTCSFVGVCDNLLVYLCNTDTRQRKSYIGYDIYGKQVFQLDIGGWGLDGVFKLSDNLFGLQGGNGDYYFCDSSGNEKPYGSFTYSIGMVHGHASYFNQDYFVLSHVDTRKMGIIDRDGTIIIPFEYKELWPLKNGKSFGLNEERRMVMVDIKGNISTPKVPPPDDDHYRTVNKTIGFYEGLFMSKKFRTLARLDSNGKSQKYHSFDSTVFAYYDSKGREILALDPKIRFAGIFTEGLTPALNEDRKLGFINLKGKWVVPPIYELQAAGAYPFPYLVVPEFKGGYAYIKAFKGYVDKKGRPYFDGKRMQDRYDFSH